MKIGKVGAYSIISGLGWALIRSLRRRVIEALPTHVISVQACECFALVSWISCSSSIKKKTRLGAHEHITLFQCQSDVHNVQKR